jgi:putative ABC transport system permease protein
MNTLALAWAQIRDRPGASALNGLLIALAAAVTTFTWLVLAQVNGVLQRDARGIDLVVGAKGSPLQLLLGGVYHLDVVPGTIKLAELKALEGNRLVRDVIPLSVGDNFRGYRIVGTTAQYPQVYGATLAQGAMFNAPMQAVAGASVAARQGLTVGTTFFGTHGLADGGPVHEDHRYTLVGILAPTGTVLDRLVLTALESVWLLHEGAPVDPAEQQALEDEREVSIGLVRYKSPIAAATVPRSINAGVAMQAAAPAVESARLMQLVEPVLLLVQGLGLTIAVLAGLSVFLTLSQALERRRHELAILRMLGASRLRVFALLLIESAGLAWVGACAGLILAHGLVALAAILAPSVGAALIDPAWFDTMELWIPVLAVGLAVLAALWPAWRAARVDVASVLTGDQA